MSSWLDKSYCRVSGHFTLWTFHPRTFSFKQVRIIFVIIYGFEDEDEDDDRNADSSRRKCIIP